MSKLIIEGNLNRNFVSQVVKLFCETLGISVPNLHIFTDETIIPNGACYRNEENDFMIVLKEQEDGQMIVTLAHELTHVKQHIKDNLTDFWDPSIPYMERWWEKEAYEKEVELMEILIEAVNSGKIIY